LAISRTRDYPKGRDAGPWLTNENRSRLHPALGRPQLERMRAYFVDVLLSRLKEDAVNWDRIEGNWKQFKGKVKEKWGDLTDDDLDRINGNREQLEGVIQERYGYAKDRVTQDVDQWSRDL
jgi:uncharacterized protein YjbJ (UPF0337 family)